MSYEYFLAKRYAFSRKRENFITIISIISMLGIGVGTAALIAVLSVFNGFSSVVTNVLVSFDPHVRIVAKPPQSATDTVPTTSVKTADITQKLASIPEISYAAPVVRGKAVIVHYASPHVCMLTGIDEAKAKEVSGLAKSIQSGKLVLDSNSIVVGQLLADELSIIIGDTLEVVSPVGLEKILTEPVTPRMTHLIVRGIFAANNREYDAMNAYTGLSTARELFAVPMDAATSVDIKLHDIQKANDVKSQLATMFDTSRYQVQTWYDLHTDLYSVMEIERWIAYIILFLIVAVASFNIFSSLTLTVFEKQRDIGLLRALGSTVKDIRRVYLLQGVLVGVVGTIGGCLLGLVIVLLQQHFGFLKLDISVYIIPTLPVELRWTDFVSVGLGSLLLSTIGAIIPAKRASRVQPAVALRWE